MYDAYCFSLDYRFLSLRLRKEISVIALRAYGNSCVEKPSRCLRRVRWTKFDVPIYGLELDPLRAYTTSIGGASPLHPRGSMMRTCNLA